MAIPLDQARLRPHLRGETVSLRGKTTSQTPVPAGVSRPNWRMAAGDADKERLRGLPMIGRGVAGVQPGSDPLGVLLAKESRRRR
jgi:hypothetical protein